MEESSASVLMAEMKDSTYVHDDEDERKQRLSDNFIASSDHSKMLLNETLQNKNQEDINLFDQMEDDEFEEDDLGNYSIEVLSQAVHETYGSNLLCLQKGMQKFQVDL
eukprot:6376852-Ditylum_brightwellii.AAC.1